MALAQISSIVLREMFSTSELPCLAKLRLKTCAGQQSTQQPTQEPPGNLPDVRVGCLVGCALQEQDLGLTLGPLLEDDGAYDDLVVLFAVLSLEQLETFSLVREECSHWLG